jgi:hypothetical protein
MLRIRDHRVDDYTVLRNIGTTDVGVLRDDDKACLDEIGQFLVLHDAWHRFAIWLLHKYFDPAPGEVFVERVITSGREMETTPLARSVIQAGGLMMTGMRFDDSVGPGVGVIGMEFANSSQCGPARPVIDDDEAVLMGIAERLRAHEKTDRFGVRLIRDPLGVTDRELLVESADTAHRTVHYKVAGRTDIRPGDTVIETTWQWKPVDKSGH